MKISVVIPAFNNEQFIGEALDSVYAQSRAADEIICVDDASTDNTADIIRKKYAKVKLLCNTENQGPSRCRNQGIAVAGGTIIAFLDADDCWTKDKILHQSGLLENDPEVEIVGGLTDFFPATGTAHATAGGLAGEPHFNAYLPSLLVRRSVFDKIGMFDTSLRLSEDQDWFFRAREAGCSIKLSDELVLLKRIHSTNTTKGLNFQESAMITALKRSLDRRRKAGALYDLKPFKH